MLTCLGNHSSPNTFSNNLLNNLADFQGTKPYIRVGGNTQDYALYNASLPYAVNGTIQPAISVDYPTKVQIGPSYFESYSTWPDVKFSHGFNMGLGGNRSAGWQTLLDTIPLACKALGGGKLLMWEYGNEPDLFSTSAQGPVRPPTWNESIYVSQWLDGSRQIKEGVAAACPDLASYGFMAPSFAGVENHLNPVTTWNEGLDVDKDIELISSHKYGLPHYFAARSLTDPSKLYWRCDATRYNTSRNPHESHVNRGVYGPSTQCIKHPCII